MALTPEKGVRRAYLAQASPWPGNEKIIERGQRGEEEKRRGGAAPSNERRTQAVYESTRISQK